jgi:alpha-galactosidase
LDASDRWTSVLGWAGDYGQLWRLGAGIQIWASWDPAADRWPSVVKNYRYTRGVGQFTRPGGWNDPDFIIGGDPGLTLDEAKSQLSLWAMMSAPLILSSDLTQVTRSPDLVAALGNAALIAVDQDPLGEPAAVAQDGATVDVLVKRLANGDRAVAVLNHGDAPASYAVAVDRLGFPACATCSHRVEDLWSGAATDRIAGTLARHATALFRVAQAP